MKNRLKYIAALIAAVMLIVSCAGSVKKAEVQPVEDLALFESAEAMFADSEYEHAILLYEKYLIQHPRTAIAPAAMLRKGMSLDKMQKHEKARSVYEQLIRKFPDTDSALKAKLEILFSYFHEGRYDSVLEYAEKLDKESFPRDMARRINLIAGDACMENKAYGEAFALFLDVFFEASKARRDYAGRRLARAAAYLDKKKLDAIIDPLGQKPPAGYLVYGKALGLVQEGSISDAAALLNGFAGRFPGHELSGEVSAKIEELDQAIWFEGRRIGVLLPLTGRYAAFGRNALDGIELALAKYQDKNQLDPPLEIIVHDTGTGERQGAKGVKALADKNVAAIIGLIVADEEAVRQAEKRRIPIVVMGQKPGITELGDYVFRNFMTPKSQVEALVEYSVKKLGLSHFAVLYPDEQYGEMFMELFCDALAENGGVLAAAEAYEPGVTDFSDPIKQMGGITPDEEDDRYETSIDFDAVFIPDSSRMAGLIIPQLRYYDINDVFLLGTNLWHSEQLIDIAGRQTRGVVIPEGFYAQSRSSEVRDFVDDFRAIYEKSPGIIEASGYDSAMMLFKLVADPDIKDRITLKNALYNMPRFNGVTGKTSFDKTGEPVKNMYLLEIVGGRFAEIQ